ncbi:hypothetical protein BGZ96_001741 [Linnemannia gamsii]|uniref:Glutathione S-transferase n=1 Tax=Linnemannia gamsii TaxID=64522 RepID=A0ABQ7KHD3_9FUNG|nr:hypothetical protein BGZ96_001741 [Linnemannia gamsii]
MKMTHHPFFNPSQSTAFAALAPARDSTFQYRYFRAHGMRAIPRTLIAIGTGSAVLSRLSNNFGEDWATYKPTTPFGVVPILIETSADGKSTIQIAESDAIERYLSRKFGLLGNGTVFEEVLVDTFSNNSQALITQAFVKYLPISDPELRADNKGPLITDNIVPWIMYHEQHLQANGANGHYVGNSVTLADVKTDYLINIIQGITGEELVSEEKTPAIWRVRKELEKIEGVAVWRGSEEYKAISEQNFAFLGFY